jgi:hypothetical protein
MNWASIESQVEELAITNDTNIWMLNANVGSPPQQITNCMGIKSYKINIEYFITPNVCISTILDLNNVLAHDQILLIHDI